MSLETQEGLVYGSEISNRAGYLRTPHMRLPRESPLCFPIGKTLWVENHLFLFFFLKWIKKYIIFVAVLGLCCSVQAFSSCSFWVSLVAEPELWRTQASVSWLSCSEACVFLTQNKHKRIFCSPNTSGFPDSSETWLLVSSLSVSTWVLVKFWLTKSHPLPLYMVVSSPSVWDFQIPSHTLHPESPKLSSLLPFTVLYLHIESSPLG